MRHIPAGDLGAGGLMAGGLMAGGLMAGGLMAGGLDALAGAWVRDLRVAWRTSGFPSPAQGHAEAGLDVRDLLMKRPAAAFLLRMEGDAMRDAGIGAGDLLVIDRSLSPRLGGVVVAAVDGELLVRRYWPGPLATYLLAAHPDHPPIRIPAEAECRVWGVVTHAIHRCTPMARQQ